jgi:signal transduction histidine kinase/CheY-like chemotaxis protein
MAGNPLSAAASSIRTKFGLATAALLLVLLLVFYLGGRYILVHMIRQAEKEIQTIGTDIRTAICGELQELQRTASEVAASAAAGGEAPTPERLQKLLAPFADRTPVHLVCALAPDGALRSGCYLAPGQPLQSIEPRQAEAYFSPSSPLAAALAGGRSTAGLIALDGKPVLIAVAPFGGAGGREAGLLVVGSLFYSAPLQARINAATHGMQVAVSDHHVESGSVHFTKSFASAAAAPAVRDIFSFYSGGSWHIGENTFEAVLPIRDILGREVATISVRLPRTFTSIASIALGWLTAFVATVGIVFVFPIFWLQTRMVLNPLSSLVSQIRQIVARPTDGERAHLQWAGRDEFALVAQSVNGLLETLSSKTQQVAQIEQRQRALIAGMPDGLCVFDRSGSLVAIHKQPDYAHPIPGLIIGQPITPPLFPESDCDALRKAIEETFRSETIQMVMIACRELDGSYRHFETRISRMDRLFSLVILRDVTQEWRERETRQQMESRLAKIEKMESLGNLAAGIAHDFNNILAIIHNTVDTTWVSPCRDDEEEIAVGTIRDATSKGAALTRELMTYAGHTRIALKRGDPNTLILDLEKLMSGVIAPNVALELKLTPGLSHVDADPHQFWKVIINILKNASEAMNGSRGHICISTYQYDMTESASEAYISTHELVPGTGVTFQIDDTGTGIPRELIGRLFEPFFSTKAVGRGLGLATVFGIVDAHNGGIAIDSEPGKGTSFRVWLPAAKETSVMIPPAESLLAAGEGEEPPSAGRDEETPQPAAPALPRVCVLIIEDDLAILQTTSILLRSLNAETFTAATKREALAVFRKHADQINLILMDAQLGSLDNVRLLATLRMRKPGIPTVIVSGHTEARIREMFSTEPFNGFLSKPYTRSELQAILAPLAARAQQQQAEQVPNPGGGLAAS